jgi:predicted O-methyltransferase YrrM
LYRHEKLFLYFAIKETKISKVGFISEIIFKIPPLRLMNSAFFKAKAYLQYLNKSGTRHSVHSPFVYSLVDEVLRNKTDYPEFREIEELRQKLLSKSQLIEITDFGAGANLKSYEHRFERVSALARKSSVDAKYGRLLFRLVGYFKSETILELGTSLGISTLYLALANREAQVYTLEGCTTKSEQASTNFQALNALNIDLHIGRFDIVLPDLLKNLKKLDFAFIDGHHTFDATIDNFETLLKIAHNDTVFIFDDIHWSRGMEKAWQQITDHQHVTVSIDLFRFGIVFLKKELSRQKFVIRF